MNSEFLGENRQTGFRKVFQNRKSVLLSVLIFSVVSIVLLVQWPGLYDNALGIDDYAYFVSNPLVKNPSMTSALTFLKEVLRPSTIGGYYQPFTMISLMLDYAMGARVNDLYQFHMTSLILHAMNTSLIILILYFLFEAPIIAAIVGLLFGVHPMTVETIVWVGERKTLLASFFAFISILTYIFYSKGINEKNRSKYYFMSILAYVFSLMSKPTSTMLPFAMLLLDFWPLKRFVLNEGNNFNRRVDIKDYITSAKKLIIEKIPLFSIFVVSMVITYISQKYTAGVMLPQKLGAAYVPLVLAHNNIFYIFKMLWPFNLTSHYPVPDPISLAKPAVLIGVIGTILLLVALIVSLKKTRALFTGWLIFFVIILPAMQIIAFSNALTSDKYAYLPSIGFLMSLTWLFKIIWEKVSGWPKRVLVNVVIGGTLLFLTVSESILTREYFPAWKDTVTLYNHMINLSPDCYILYYNLGYEYHTHGESKKAVDNYKKAIRLKPDFPLPYINMGNLILEKDPDGALDCYQKGVKNLGSYYPSEVPRVYWCIGDIYAKKGKTEEAIANFKKVLRIDPQYTAATKSLQALTGSSFGVADSNMNSKNIAQYDEEVAKFRAYVKDNPNDPSGYVSLGKALSNQNNVDEGVEIINKGIAISPNYTDLYDTLGDLLYKQKKYKEALENYKKVYEAKPDDARIIYNMGLMLHYMSDLKEAIKNYEMAIKINPKFINAYNNLAAAYQGVGDIDKAIVTYQDLIKFEPKYEIAHANLGKILQKEKRYEEARKEYEIVMKINPNADEIKDRLDEINNQ